jgi:hypothetical protein
MDSQTKQMDTDIQLLKWKQAEDGGGMPKGTIVPKCKPKEDSKGT